MCSTVDGVLCVIYTQRGKGGRSFTVWGRTGIDSVLEITCARLCECGTVKTLKTLTANDNVTFDYALAA